MAFDGAGNLYVSSETQFIVNKINPQGVVSTFATMPDEPEPLAFDSLGNLVVFTLQGRLYKVTPDGTPSLFAIPGKGTGGPSYASYAALVKTIYENAWQAPEDTATDNAITKVTVTILSDGTVYSRRIIGPSGDAGVSPGMAPVTCSHQWTNAGGSSYRRFQLIRLVPISVGIGLGCSNHQSGSLGGRSG